MRMYCVASTQTDAILDSEEKRNVAVQTMNELTPESVHDVLSGGDRQLAEHIASIIKEKLHAESDHQRALIQLEQRLKDENDIQVVTDILLIYLYDYLLILIYMYDQHFMNRLI